MVYIIVLNWNGFEDTIECLKSIAKLNYFNYRVIICDNFSSDNSYERLASWIPAHFSKRYNLVLLNHKNNACDNSFEETEKNNIYLIQTGANLGYAGGNNIGISFAKEMKDMSHVWILNNDTIVDDNSLSILIKEAAANPSIGIWGSKLVYHYSPQVVQAIGGTLNRFTGTTKHVANNTFINAEIKTTLLSKVDYIVGASLLITKSTLDKIGLLSEDYFLYYEEIDYCLRAKKKSINISVALDSIVYHKEGASTGTGVSVFSDYYLLSSRLKFMKKFYSNRVVFVKLFFLLLVVKRFFKLEIRKAFNILKLF